MAQRSLCFTNQLSYMEGKEILKKQNITQTNCSTPGNYKSKAAFFTIKPLSTSYTCAALPGKDVHFLPYLLPTGHVTPNRQGPGLVLQSSTLFLEYHDPPS